MRIYEPFLLHSDILIVSAVEFATVGKTKDGKIYHHLWSAEEIEKLLKENDLAKEDTNDGDRVVT